MGYQKAVDALYETVFEPGSWSTAAVECARLVNGSTLFVQVVNPATGYVNVVSGHGLESLGIPAYEAHYYKLDVWRHGLLASPRDRVHLYPEVVAQSDYENSEVFNDWVKPVVGFDIYWGLGGVFDLGDGLVGALASHRSRRQGEMSETDRAVFQRLLPHVRRVIKLRRLAEAREAHANSLEALCDETSPPALLADENGRLVYANSRATTLLKRADGLKLRADSMIEARLPNETALLHREIAAACRLGTAEEADLRSPLRISQAGSTRPLVVTVSPVPLELFSQTSPRALVFIEDIWSTSAPPAEKIMFAFGLTVSEARLVASLSEGLALRDAALRNGIAYNTARAHLRNVLAKAGVTRQSELMLHVARLR